MVRSRTKYLVVTDQDHDRKRNTSTMTFYGQALNGVRSFRYLGSTDAADEHKDVDVSRRIQAGWKH